MKRPLSILLANAFDRAAHDVFIGPQVHAAYDDPSPSAGDKWVYWIRGFVAGLVDDYESKPLSVRVSKCLNRAYGRIRGFGTSKIGSK